MASQVPAKKGVEFTLDFTLYKNDGTVVANPGTITKKISKDEGNVADITASVTEEDTTYGQCSIVLSATEMNADRVWIYIKDDTTGCVPFTCTIYTAANLVDDIKTDTAAILLDTGTDGVIIPQAQADKVWSSTTRTLSAFSFTVAANLTQILGTALTETSGYIAAAFKKFFNIADTNVPAANAIALEATLTSMKGATFDTSTDSLEAIRNRGDAAWTSGSAQPLPYAPTSVAYTTGDDESGGGTFAKLATHDEDYLQCGENGGLEFEVLATLSGKQSEIPSLCRISAMYSGSTGHELSIEAYNYTTAAYEHAGTMKPRTTFFDYVIPLDSDNHDPANGSMKIRFLHNVVSYVGSHNLRVDYVSFEKRTTTDALSADVAAILSMVNDIDVEVDDMVTNGVKLGDVAHGGAAATITTSNGELGNLAKSAMQDSYLVADWSPTDFNVTFDGTLGVGGYVDIYAEAGNVKLGRYTTAGGWVVDAAFDGRKLGVVYLDSSGVTAAGTLTLTIPNATESPLIVPIPLRVTGAGYEYGPVYRDGSGLSWYTQGGGGRNIEVAQPVILANAAHGGAAATITAERIIVASTTGNEPAVKLTGAGAGQGLIATGGDTGSGVKITGGATSGQGLECYGTGTDGFAIVAQASGTGSGIYAQSAGSGYPAIWAYGGSDADGIRIEGTGTGSGIYAKGGATGKGVELVGGSTSGDGIKITTTDGHGISVTAGGTNKHGMTLTGTGKDIDADEIDAAAAGGGASAADIADAVWDEAIADHVAAGSTGKKLSDAGAAGDPWDTAIPGAYTTGKAGNVVGTLLAREATVLGQFSVTQGIIVSPSVSDNSTLTVVRGDQRQITFTLGTAWNLTGKKVHFTYKKSASDATEILSAECTVTDAVNGIATYTPATTAFPTAGKYAYDVCVTETDGTLPQTAFIGTLKIQQDVKA